MLSWQHINIRYLCPNHWDCVVTYLIPGNNMVTQSFGSIYYRTLLCIAFPFQKIIEIMTFLWAENRGNQRNPYLSRREPVFIPFFPAGKIWVFGHHSSMQVMRLFNLEEGSWRLQGPKNYHISSIVGNAHSKPDGNGGGSGRKHFFSNNIIWTGLNKCGMRGIGGKWMFDEISVKWWTCKNQGFGQTFLFWEKLHVFTQLNHDFYRVFWVL